MVDVTVLPQLLQISSLRQSDSDQTYGVFARARICHLTHVCSDRAFVETSDRAVYRSQIRDLNESHTEMVDFSCDTTDMLNLDENGEPLLSLQCAIALFMWASLTSRLQMRRNCWRTCWEM